MPLYITYRYDNTVRFVCDNIYNVYKSARQQKSQTLMIFKICAYILCFTQSRNVNSHNLWENEDNL